MRYGPAELYSAFDSPPTGIDAFLQRLAARYGLAPPLRVLDVGCGPGRLLRPLERLRWEVTGMEPNPDFLAAARTVAAGSRRIRVRPGGFGEIEDEAAFDLVVAVNRSFAHLLSRRERADALRRVRRALRPGGVVFLDLPSFPWLLRHLRQPEPFSASLHGREVVLHRRHELDEERATCTTTDRYLFADGASPPVHLVHAYGMARLPEIESLLGEAGLGEILTFPGYDAAAPGPVRGARTLVAARRPPDGPGPAEARPLRSAAAELRPRPRETRCDSAGSRRSR